MNWQIGLYFGMVLAAFVVSAFLAWQAWNQRRVPGSRYYFWVAAALCLLALGEALSMRSPTPALALFWFKTRFLPFAVIPPLWLLFVLEYSGRRNWISKGLIVGLFVIPLTTQVMLWTDGLHGLWVRREVIFLQSGPFWMADISQRIPGLWFLLHIFTSLVLILAGSILLLQTAWRNARLFRLQAAFLAASALIPMITAVVTTFNLMPKGAINPTLPGLALSAALAAAAIFRFDFLKKSPSAGASQALEAARGTRTMIFLLLVFGLLAAGLTAIGVASYQNYRAKFHTQVENELLSIASLKVSGLQEWRSERLADASLLRDSPALSGLVQSYLAGPGDAKSASELQTGLDSLREGDQYDRVFLLDTSGVERISSPATPEEVTPDLTGQEQAILKGGQVGFLDFHRDTPGGPIHLAFLVPIYTDETLKEPLGMLVLRVVPETYLYPYLSQWPAPSATAETLLARREDGNVLFLSPLRFQPQAALTLRFPLTDTNILAVKAVSGQSGVVEGIDYRGQAVIGAILPVAGTPWFLVARMDLAEADAPLKDRLWLTVIFFGMLILASGAGLTVLWRQQRMQYYRGQAQVAEALRESEDKFKYVFDHSIIGKSITLPSGEISVNQAFCAMLGYTAEELSHKKWQEITHPDDIATTQRILDPILAGEREGARFEKRYLRKDGSIVWADETTSLRRDDQGNPLYYMTSIMDISERRQAEHEIAETLQAFTTIFQESSIAMVLSSIEDGLILDANMKWLEMSGFSREEVIGKSAAELGRWKNLDDRAKMRNALQEHGEVRDWEVTFVRPNGEEYLVLLSAKIVNLRGKPVLLSSNIDITARKLAEQALRESEEQFRTFAQSAHDAIFMIDEQANIVFWNAAAERMFGYPAAEVLGKSLTITIPVHMRDSVQAGFQRVITTGNVNQAAAVAETVRLRKDGSQFPAEVVISLHEIKGSRHVTAIVRDITERKQAGEALHQAMEDLARSNAELEQFAYVASHDLQEPLRMVSSYMQLLERRYKGSLDQDADEFIGFAVDGASRMKKLINDLLAYSRVGTRGAPFALTSSQAALDQALDNLQVAIRESQARVTHDPLPEVVADETQLIQLFQNLVGNAIKFHGKKRPQVHISAALTPYPPSRSTPVGLPKSGEGEGGQGVGSEVWRFSVRDNGIGIDPQYFERIFIIFQRLNGRLQYPGTGIGLAICRKIVERHGGRIWVESAPGNGATFHFTLPKTGGTQA